MARAGVTAGSAVSFVVAAVAGVLGNQLTEDALWAWVSFAVVLVLGAAVTAFVAYRSAPGPDDIAEDGGRQPDPGTVEGPVAGGDVTLKGTYVAGHDLIINGTDGERGTKRP